MDNNIKYRACIVNIGITTKRGVFHQWTLDGGAIVGGEDRECNIYPCSSVRFLKPIIDELIDGG